MILPEMLNTIKRGTQKVREAWAKGDKPAAWKAYKDDMNWIVSIGDWDPSRYSNKIRNPMREISRILQDEGDLFGSMHSEDDFQRIEEILSDILQFVGECERAFSNTEIHEN